ncbi:MAG: DsrE family protein [Solirubrobacterales bacterium]
MNILVIVNDQPYSSERPYNALRLATELSEREGIEMRIFLFGDAVMCAIAGQHLPAGHYHRLDHMLNPLVHRGEVACCGTCMDARGLEEETLIEGARRSKVEELADWALWAEKTLTF